MTKGDPLEAPRQPPVEQRVLTHAEVGLLWGKLGWWRHDAAARFMLLSGARREEVCGATWGEINFTTGVWVLPGRRRKNPRALHRVQRGPYCPAVTTSVGAIKSKLGVANTTVWCSQVNGMRV